MNIITTENIYARFAIGLEIRYTKEPIPADEVYDFLEALQRELHKKENLTLSANCFESCVVMNKQKEPHLNIHFINYPRFPCTDIQFREAVIFIVTKLMNRFQQNRVVIEFPKELVMLQETDEVDGRILL